MVILFVAVSLPSESMEAKEDVGQGLELSVNVVVSGQTSATLGSVHARAELQVAF